jgi:hypothetical protein
MNPLNPNPTKSELEEAIKAAGFQPPIITYKKRDPRGGEYGRFEVNACEDTHGTRSIGVSHIGQSNYTMFFKCIEHFQEWAKDCS